MLISPVIAVFTELNPCPGPIDAVSLLSYMVSNAWIAATDTIVEIDYMLFSTGLTANYAFTFQDIINFGVVIPVPTPVPVPVPTPVPAPAPPPGPSGNIATIECLLASFDQVLKDCVRD